MLHITEVGRSAEIFETVSARDSARGILVLHLVVRTARRASLLGEFHEASVDQIGLAHGRGGTIVLVWEAKTLVRLGKLGLQVTKNLGFFAVTQNL